jgi:transcriptional repressor NrdR
MKCPFCGFENDKVVDSRESKEGDSIRRRRECLKCEKRFTTYERIDEIPYMVVKKDGRRERFRPPKSPQRPDARLREAARADQQAGTDRQ